MSTPDIGRPAVCTNINECLSSPCTQGESDQVCNDLEGTFACACGPGYSGDSVIGDFAICSDIDECENDVCQNSIQNCENLAGSFSCACKEGYEGRL